MLKRLTLENIAIVDALEVSFEGGLTVITGETGAGKSIMIEAVAMAFGAKAPAKDILRTGSPRGRIELLLDLSALKDPEPVRRFLSDQALELLPEETELLISREFTPTASRCRVNGTPVTREVLDALRPYFLDCHGQHELTGLFHRSVQRACLDGLGGESLKQIKIQVARAFQKWQLARQKLTRHQADQQSFQSKKDFLTFQLNELMEADLNDPDEDSHTQIELERLTHGEKLRQSTAQAVELLSEGDYEKSPAITELLARVQKIIAEGARVDVTLTPLLERATGLYEESRALALDLGGYHEDLESDPARINVLVDRLDLLEKLKRKYGPTLAEVLSTRDRLSEELASQEAGENNLEALEAACAEAETALIALTAQLSEARIRVADSLKSLLEEQLRSLALPSAMFDIVFHPTPPGMDGGEEVEFLFSANPGEPLRPLAKVASGGELSRFLLALKVLTAESGTMQTLIFDEIDTGMSGNAAKSVGEKLLALARHLQVLVITHQPIVAAMGDHHLHVQKRVVEDEAGENPRVQVEAVNLQEKEKRLAVLSRLASGIDTDDEAVENYILRLLNQAEACKSV